MAVAKADLKVCATPVAVLVFVFGVAGRANEKPSAEYRATMQELQAASEIMRHHARMVEPGGDFGYDWIETDANRLKNGFERTLDFWAGRNVKRAMQYAKDAASDASVLERAAKRRHYDGVVAGVAGVLAACEPCHAGYREQLADGSFEIR